MIEKQYLSIHGFISNQKITILSLTTRVFSSWWEYDSKRPALETRSAFDCINILLMTWQMEKS